MRVATGGTIFAGHDEGRLLLAVRLVTTAANRACIAIQMCSKYG